MLRAQILKDMDRLEHSKEDGFYDKDLDLFFTDLNEWCNRKWRIDLVEVGI
jgi:hypothetical protein